MIETPSREVLRRVLQAVTDDAVVSLPSGDPAGPDAAALLWDRPGSTLPDLGTSEESLALLCLETAGHIVPTLALSEVPWCGTEGGQVAVQRLVMTEAGHRLLGKLDREAQDVAGGQR
ncbi:hypothetical protein D5S17_28995 [Pseudonocardiaceae bacterium YIM PH 21723]|nr:hypothetical protein D5S17_28995 [Pseudonocardiaceae bacterium YIM PH 21723]